MNLTFLLPHPRGFLQEPLDFEKFKFFLCSWTVVFFSNTCRFCEFSLHFRGSRNVFLGSLRRHVSGVPPTCLISGDP